jgi:hypothetical protein
MRGAQQATPFLNVLVPAWDLEIACHSLLE